MLHIIIKYLSCLFENTRNDPKIYSLEVAKRKDVGEKKGTERKDAVIQKENGSFVPASSSSSTSYSTAQGNQTVSNKLI